MRAARQAIRRACASIKPFLGLPRLVNEAAQAHVPPARQDIAYAMHVAGKLLPRPYPAHFFGGGARGRVCVGGGGGAAVFPAPTWACCAATSSTSMMLSRKSADSRRSWEGRHHKGG